MTPFKRFPKSVILATIGLIGAIFYVVNVNKATPAPKEFRQPPQKPYASTIVGTGIIESREENIDIAPYWEGKVSAVYVREGERVRKGDPLFRLDTDELNAQLTSQQAQVQVQQANLERLRHEPRPETVVPLQAALRQADANLQDQKSQLARLESIGDPGSISRDELSRQRYAVQSAQAQRERARAELAQVQAGAWVYDIRKAEADLQTMRSRIREIQVKLNQSVVRSPIDGQVLQVNIRPGEFAGLRETTPLMLLGNTDTLQVRVDVDEVNASRVRPGMAGTATLKGEPKAKFPLRFVRVEPYMVPKKNLSGSNLERVDVRVLQLIYEFSPPQYPVYVGQQVDVFLDKSS